MQRDGGRINFLFNDSFSSSTAENDGLRKGEQINLKLKAPAEQSRDGAATLITQEQARMLRDT